jgi:hypothetical protein
MPTLKKQNRKTLVGFILVNVILFSLLSNNFYVDSTGFSDLINNPLDPKILSVILLFGLSIILEGILSSNLKAIIVFHRIKNPLPGCRVFTEIARKDSRINMQKLAEKYDNKLPSEAASQNSEWFRLYKLYEKVEVVEESHKSFLMTRDLLALSIILLILSTILHIALGTSAINIIYSTMIYVALIIVFKISAQNYGNRFTANVIVEYLN